MRAKPCSRSSSSRSCAAAGPLVPSRPPRARPATTKAAAVPKTARGVCRLNAIIPVPLVLVPIWGGGGPSWLRPRVRARTPALAGRDDLLQERLRAFLLRVAEDVEIGRASYRERVCQYV